MKPPLIPRYRNFQERRRAWLTGTFLKDFGRSDMELYEPTKEQIKLDTARSFTQFAGLTLSPLTPKLHLEIDDVTRGELRRQLEVVLCRFFCLYPDYHYFQVCIISGCAYSS